MGSTRVIGRISLLNIVMGNFIMGFTYSLNRLVKMLITYSFLVNLIVDE